MRMALWTIGYLAFVNTTRSLAPYIGTNAPVSTGYAYVPMVAFFLPIALLLAIGLGGRTRPSPALGLGLAAVLLGVPLLGWGVPIANRAFLDANPFSITSPQSTSGSTEVHSRPWQTGEGLLMATNSGWRSVESFSPPVSFTNDLTVPQLGRKIAAGPNQGGWNAIQWLSFFGGYVAMCMLIPAFAYALWRTRTFVRFAVIAVTTGLLLDHRGLEALAGKDPVLSMFGVHWIPALLMALGLVALMRSDRAASVGNVSGVEP